MTENELTFGRLGGRTRPHFSGGLTRVQWCVRSSVAAAVATRFAVQGLQTRQPGGGGGTYGRCTGIDISAPMIAAARVRAERERTPASFVCADAQGYQFVPASFDRIVSRFGVMFFEDPVRALANLRRAASEGAELRFVAWRSAAENPFMTTAERSAAPLLSALAPRRPNAPGQFAFADGHRVQAILEASSWVGIEIHAVDAPCALPEKDLIHYLARLGPVGRLLDDCTRAQVIEVVRPAFDSYVSGGEVHLTAACWVVAARASSLVDSISGRVG